MGAEARKNIPFVIIGIVVAFLAVDTFTPYEISEETMSLIQFVLTPFGLAGLANKGWDVYKQVKQNQGLKEEDLDRIGKILQRVFKKD